MTLGFKAILALLTLVAGALVYAGQSTGVIGLGSSAGVDRESEFVSACTSVNRNPVATCECAWPLARNSLTESEQDYFIAQTRMDQRAMREMIESGEVNLVAFGINVSAFSEAAKRRCRLRI